MKDRKASLPRELGLCDRLVANAKSRYNSNHVLAHPYCGAGVLTRLCTVKTEQYKCPGIHTFL